MSGWPDPTVVISDKAPPTVQCRDDLEVAACNNLLQIMRRGGDPLVVIYRLSDRRVEVAARSSSFTSVGDAAQLMKEATLKLTANLFGKLRARA